MLARLGIAGVLALLLIGLGSLPRTSHAQFNGCQAGFCSPAATTGTFQGVGDVIASWYMWGSCARVYNAASASTATSLCDLVATGNGSSVCTLRGTTSGKVDLVASYCNGTTPSLACPAANGGSCSVSKVYDQSGNSRPLTQATLANMPTLAFNVSNGLPCTSWSNLTAATLQFSGTFSQAQPLTASTVVNHTSGTTNLVYQFNHGGGNGFFSSTANIYTVNAGNTNATVTVSDGVLHAIQTVYDDSNSLDAVYSDGTNTGISGIGTNGISNVLNWSGTDSGTFGFNGTICELGFNAVSMSSGQKSNMNSNQHGTNGYNF